MAPTSDADKAALEKTTADLDQDWVVVAEYEADELADNSDDEKRLYRARKERNGKKRKAAMDNSARKRSRGEGATRTADMQPRPPPPKTRPLGPCYMCGEYGHLARNCAKAQRPYPFDSCKSIDVCWDMANRYLGSLQPVTKQVPMFS